jgi:hypothetical protein
MEFFSFSMAEAFDRAWNLVKASIDPDSGVLVDGSEGIYMGQMIQQIANGLGYVLTALDPDHEEYDDATDEAVEWLNENIAKEGHLFDYHPDDRHFMYMPEEWYDDELSDVIDFPTMIDDANKGRRGGWR